MADWKFWGGRDTEYMQFGPCDTREEAVNEGFGQCGEGGFYIIEAVQSPVDVAAYLDVDNLIETLGESIEENCGDPDGGNDPLLDLGKAETASLEGMLRAEIRRWQELHGIVIRPWAFSAVRSEEFISAAPGHTDLMVSPEEIDAFVTANPPDEAVAA